MRVVLVGADFEENLGVGMIAAAACDAGHRVRIVAFNRPEEAPEVAERALAEQPDVIGLSIQFQHRAHEFLGLARSLRARGFEGHICCGGQFPTLAWREVVGRDHGVDSVVLHEGEKGFVELLDALSTGRRVGEVPGLALVADDGAPIRTEPRPILADLDALPFPVRYRAHAKHVGVPFIPLMGGRGCWGNCSYCSITSFYRDARAYGGGPTLRQRSPENVAQEMALLWHGAGGPSIFCFHDDNMLLPRPGDTIARMRAIREELDRYGVGKIGIIGKCRPDTLTPELARELAALGVIRLYVGVENASEPGAAHLRRGRQTRAVAAALEACEAAGIFVCYNLLVFEPDATIDDVRANIAFVRAQADHPINFCRAEPYFGTPLHLELAESQGLGGSYLGWNYRIGDDRAELLFRVCAAAFRERNFAPNGVANRYMGLGYGANILRHFYDPADPRVRLLTNRALRLTRGIALETADFLEQAADLVEGVDPGQREDVERRTAILGLAVAEADRRWHAAIDGLREDMDAFVEASDLPAPAVRPNVEVLKLARNVALGASIALWSSACDCSESVDPVPRDSGMVADPPPRDAGVDAGVVDPPPRDAGVDAGVVDPAPVDAGVDAGRDAGFVADPPPPDAGVDADMPVDPAPGDGAMGALAPGASVAAQPRLALVDQWRDSSPRRAVRTTDLPLSNPPEVRLVGVRDGDAVRVSLLGGPGAVSTRWQSDGHIEGDGREVRWRPANEGDHIRVAVRAAEGVAVVSLRARHLPEAG